MRYLCIILVLALCSCKVRQVSKTIVHSEKDSARTVVRDSSGSKTTHLVDTSKKQVVIKTTDRDSSEVTTIITPDSGATIVVKSDGSIMGQIKSIISHKTSHSSRTKEKTSIQKTGIDSSTTQKSLTHVLDSGHTHMARDSISKQTHSDSTIAANFPWKWVLIIVAGLLILGGLFWKFRKFFGL